MEQLPDRLLPASRRDSLLFGFCALRPAKGIRGPEFLHGLLSMTNPRTRHIRFEKEIFNFKKQSISGCGALTWSALDEGQCS